MDDTPTINWCDLQERDDDLDSNASERSILSDGGYSSLDDVEYMAVCDSSDDGDDDCVIPVPSSSTDPHRRLNGAELWSAIGQALTEIETGDAEDTEQQCPPKVKLYRASEFVPLVGGKRKLGGARTGVSHGVFKYGDSYVLDDDFIQPKKGRLEPLKVPSADFEWSRTAKRKPRRVPFDLKAEPEMKDDMNASDPAVDIFLRFFEDAQKLWIKHSNTKGRENTTLWNKRHKSKRRRVWRDITETDAMAFVAILLWMDTHPKPRISDYWSRNKLKRDEFVVGVSATLGMSGRRFCRILQATRLYSKRDAAMSGCSDRSSPNYNMLHKVDEYYLLLTKAFQRYRTPGAHLALDESMIRFKGVCAFVQSMPLKPIRRGIKQYYLCDANDAYVFNILTHANQTLPYWEEFGYLFSVCWTLLRGLNGDGLATYLDNGRTLYTDRYYTCIPLAVALAHRSTYLVGTVKKLRKLMPSGKLIVGGEEVQSISKKEMPRGSAQFFHDNKGVCTLAVWMDSAIVPVLSTHPTVIEQMSLCNRKVSGKPSKDELPRPLLLALFDRNMSGVDKCDQLLAAHNRHMRSCVWYMSLFYRGVHLCVTNTFAVKKRVGAKVTMLNLKNEIAIQLVKKAQRGQKRRPQPWYTLPVDSELRNPSSCCLAHTPDRLYGSERRICRFCRVSKSDIFCQLCKVALHGGACWYCFHHPKDE